MLTEKAGTGIVDGARCETVELRVREGEGLVARRGARETEET